MSTTAPLPWYRHFWPWFVLGLLGTSIVGSLTTVYIAFSGRDPEVRDTWSSDAKAVTRDDAPDQLADALGLSARIVALDGAPIVRVTLFSTADAALADRITARLVHPTLQQRDLEITLRSVGVDAYEGELASPITGRFHLLLEGEARVLGEAEPAPWRLGTRTDVVRGRAIEIGPIPDAGRVGS